MHDSSAGESEHKEIKMDFAVLRQELMKLDAASLCDANKQIRVMDSAIRPVRLGLKLVGRAYTVRCDDDFLMMFKSLQQAQPGDVLVVDTRGSRRAVAGELFSMEAQRRGLAGIVVDGAIRDTEKIRSFSIPVYSRSITPVSGTVARILAGQLSIQCGGVSVNPGDIIVGDDDGIVVAGQDEIEALLPAAAGIQQAEEAALERMRKGESLLDLVNFDEHYGNVLANRESRLKFG